MTVGRFGASNTFSLLANVRLVYIAFVSVGRWTGMLIAPNRSPTNSTIVVPFIFLELTTWIVQTYSTIYGSDKSL